SVALARRRLRDQFFRQFEGEVGDVHRRLNHSQTPEAIDMRGDLTFGHRIFVYADVGVYGRENFHRVAQALTPGLEHLLLAAQAVSVERVEAFYGVGDHRAVGGQQNFRLQSREL